MKIEWINSNSEKQWENKVWAISHFEPTLTNLKLNGCEYQKMKGFGACFNELGYKALKRISNEDQNRLMEALFAENDSGAHLNFCRLPIGANDYSEDWYSLNDINGDYSMEHFSIERDKKYLLPYIWEAQKINPSIKFFASPWSPPVWMKNPPVYNWGKLIKTRENLQAYALYFVKYVEAYLKENVLIEQVHIQNEPVANQKFPSCMWTGEELRDFIRDYLGPSFKANGIKTEIWLGTINAPGCDFNRLIFDKWATEDYDYFANVVLSDESALQYISGVSYQWGGKIAIQRTFESWWPQVRLMQTENECGFGDNTWEYALYNWTMMKHYISNGAESYMYWNMVLEPNGISTWGDPQNSMITVEPNKKTYQLNPDYYIMRHFSSFVDNGAVRLGTSGSMSGDSVVFRNPDGSRILVVLNPFRKNHTLTFEDSDHKYSFDLEPMSVNSIRISG